MLNVRRGHAENVNWATFQIEKDNNLNTMFTLYNEATVARPHVEPEPEPAAGPSEPKINEVRDTLWAKQKITCSGHAEQPQGESVSASAARLRAHREWGRLRRCGPPERLSQPHRPEAHGCGKARGGHGRGAEEAVACHGRRQDALLGTEIDCETVAGGAVQQRLRGTSRPLPAEEVYNCRCALRFVLPEFEYDDVPDYTKEGRLRGVEEREDDAAASKAEV